MGLSGGHCWLWTKWLRCIKITPQIICHTDNAHVKERCKANLKANLCMDSKIFTQAVRFYNMPSPTSLAACTVKENIVKDQSRDSEFADYSI